MLLVGSFINVRRQSPGLVPTTRRKDLMKCDWSANPQASAICVSLSRVDVNMSLARSTLRDATYAMGEDPRLCLNAREKWLGLKATRSATSRTSIFNPRWPSMYSTARLACQAARPPRRNILSSRGPFERVASKFPLRNLATGDARQVDLGLGSKDAVDRIVGCPPMALDSFTSASIHIINLGAHSIHPPNGDKWLTVKSPCMGVDNHERHPPAN